MDHLYMLLSTALFLVALSTPLAKPLPPRRNSGGPAVLLLCPNGFLPEYVSSDIAPNLAELARKSVQVHRVRPVFPTLPLPNQMSVLTGLPPEKHGLVDDWVFDPIWEETISSKSHDVSPKWLEGVQPAPIWEELESLGYRSEVEGFPQFRRKLDLNSVEKGNSHSSEGNSKRDSGDGDGAPTEHATKIIQWLTAGEEQPKFMGVFLEEPGRTAERYGIHAEETLASAREVDEMIGSLLQQLDKHGLRDDVNIIITGLHGMANVHDEIFLEDLVDSADYELYSGSPQPMAAIWPAMGREGSTFRNLTGGRPHMNVYLKHDMPTHLQYRNHRRIAPIVALANEGWVISKSRLYHPHKRGSAGYDNTLPSMHSFMVASGPGLAKNRTVPSMNVTDIYHLVCHLLDVKKLMSNTSRAVSEQFISQPCTQSQTCLSASVDKNSRQRHESSLGAAEAFILVCVFGLAVILTVVVARRWRGKSPAQAGYRRLEPDLSLRTEPLLNGSVYRVEDSIQLSVLSESKNGLNDGDDDPSDDDSPPGTFTI